VHEAVVEDRFGIDAEEHPAVARGRHDHHRRGLAGAEGCIVDDDLDTVVAIADVANVVGDDPDRRLGRDDVALRQRRVRLRWIAIGTRPAHAVVAVAARRERDLSFAIRVGLALQRQHVLVLVAARLELPAAWIVRFRRKDAHRAAHALELRAADFVALRIDPRFVPPVARDRDRAARLDGIVIGVECLERNGRLLVRLVYVMLRIGVNNVALECDAQHCRCR